MQASKYGGGRLVQHVEITAIYLGEEWETDAALQAMACKINDFLDDILDSAYLDQFAQYSIGNYKIGRGKMVRSIVMPHNPRLEDSLESAFGQGMLPSPNDNSIYIFYTTTYLRPPNQHFDYKSASTGQQVVYASVDYFNPSAPEYAIYFPNGDGVGIKDVFDHFTFYTTHQLGEAITSPVGGTGWLVQVVDTYYDQIGTFCERKPTTRFHGYLVAPTWNLQTGTCLLPMEDGLAREKREVRIHIQEKPCQISTTEGSLAHFQAELINFSLHQNVQYKWSAIGASKTLNNTSNIFTVEVPPAGTQFRVAVEVTSDACKTSAEESYMSIPFAEAGLAENLCKLSQLMRVPYFGPDPEIRARAFNPFVLGERDILRLEQNARQISELVGQIRVEFNALFGAR